MWAKDGVVVVAIPEVTRDHELTDVPPRSPGVPLRRDLGIYWGTGSKWATPTFFINGTDR